MNSRGQEYTTLEYAYIYFSKALVETISIPKLIYSQSEIDGVVSFGKIKRGNREIIVESKLGEVMKYLVKLSNQILVQERILCGRNLRRVTIILARAAIRKSRVAPPAQRATRTAQPTRIKMCDG